MWSVLFDPDPGDKDTLVTELWDRKTLGIIEEEQGLRAFFPGAIDLTLLSGIPGKPVDARSESEIAEATFIREGWDPILIGERFYVTPPWLRAPTPPGRLRLEIDSPTAFGTGRHETTQLSLQALERHLCRDDTVIDVGCGSGILSTAALLLGARQVVACDIHADAAEAARRNRSVQVFIGSADVVRDAFADIVIANISAAVLDRLAAELRRVAKPGGLIIISGFVQSNPPKLFVAEEVLERGDWLCWVCRSNRILAPETCESLEALSHSFDWWL